MACRIYVALAAAATVHSCAQRCRQDYIWPANNLEGKDEAVRHIASKHSVQNHITDGQ